MNNEYLDKLNEAIGALLIVIGSDYSSASEDDDQFSLKISPEGITQFINKIRIVSPYSSVYTITVDCSIQNGSSLLEVVDKDELKIITPWFEDTTLSPKILEPESHSLIKELSDCLSSEELINLDYFSDILSRSEIANAEINLFININLDKAFAVKEIQLSDEVNGVLYISSEKLLQRIIGLDYQNLTKIFAPNYELLAVLLLGDVDGIGIGTNLRIYGRDKWNKLNDLLIQNPVRELIKNAIKFRNDECQWEFPVSGLTPYHLNLITNELSIKKIAIVFIELCNKLCLIFLANHSSYENNTLSSQFYGNKRAIVTVNPAVSGQNLISIFDIFNWCYENGSSDKIGLFRQIITLYLDENPNINYPLIMSKSADLLITVKNNYQFYLKRNVEAYFDKRLKLSDLLQKYSDEISTTIYGLTSELTNDLYKTVGVIIAGLIATLIAKDQTANVIHWTALLYLLYIIFILIYSLPSTLIRYREKVKDYDENITQLKSLMLAEEAEKLERSFISRWKSSFNKYFVITYIGYGVLVFLTIIILFINDHGGILPSNIPYP